MIPKQLLAPLRYTAILSLVLAFALSTASPAKANTESPSGTNTYSDSIVIKYNDKFNEEHKIVLIDGEVEAKVKKGAVDDFLEDYNLNEVEIKITLEQTGENLTFHIGPSGLYFNKPLKLKIKGKDAKQASVQIYNDMGEPLSCKTSEKAKEITFEIDDLLDYDFADDFVAAYYSGSQVMDEDGGTITLNAEAEIRVKNKALTNYLKGQGLEAVEITVEMFYIWDGSLLFVFGPSGAFFEPELELEIEGGYLIEDMMLYGKDGEALEYTANKNGTKLRFYIPHFSSYYYDSYDY